MGFGVRLGCCSAAVQLRTTPRLLGICFRATPKSDCLLRACFSFTQAEGPKDVPIATSVCVCVLGELIAFRVLTINYNRESGLGGDWPGDSG